MKHATLVHCRISKFKNYYGCFFFVLLSACLLPVIAHAITPPDGGMYPVSMLDKVPLKKAGLRISNNDIYNPNGTGILQAIVQIGGCTGSFVSGEGLIITNHHCAFGSLAPYSSTGENLLEKGYLAKTRKLELPMKGLTCKILESHKDVSEEVIRGIENISDPVLKRELIEKNLNRIQQGEQLKSGDYSIEVSEMLPGKSYVLFRYKVIRDLRIVYIPPRNIGEFGGETDNWVWPRHTGDFSFIRAYVSKTGQGNRFDSANIPYEPKEYLNINSSGLKEGDFVFILGYPGRTYRNLPAEFINYQEQYQLPFIAELYEWQINTTLELGKKDLAYKIKQDPKIKSLANVMKNYKGKLKGLENLDLYRQKKKEDAALAEKIKDPVVKQRYLKTLNDIDSLYSLDEIQYRKYAWYIQLLGESYFIKIAHVVDLYRDLAAKNKNVDPKTRKEYVDLLRQYYKNNYPRFDTLYLIKMLTDASHFDNNNKPDNIASESPAFEGTLRKALANSRLLDSSFVIDMIMNRPGRAARLHDPFITLAHNYYRDYLRLDSLQSGIKIKLDALQTSYVDIKMQVLNEDFIPDANHTLRITYGYIKGFSPRDGVYYKPFTSVYGMLEKNGQNEDYSANDTLLKTYRQNIESEQQANHDVPLCLLYNTDTTGGNSGSPVLNKYGQLVGLNFDRNYEATVNDYAWNDKYSRSVGLDMRFVLWELSKVAGAKNILAEMFIDE
jgi:hypothetical protein